jgi:hypothetical protein
VYVVALVCAGSLAAGGCGGEEAFKVGDCTDVAPTGASAGDVPKKVDCGEAEAVARVEKIVEGNEMRPCGETNPVKDPNAEGKQLCLSLKSPRKDDR